MKERFLSAMLSVAMAASLVIECADSSSGTTDTKAENAKTGNTKTDSGAETGKKGTQATSGEYVTLTVIDRYTPEGPHGQCIYQYVEEFMKKNPSIKVEVQAIASGDIYIKLAAMATSPDDFPTVFSISADQVPTLYNLGLTEDLASWMNKEIIGGLTNGVMDAYTIDGQVTYYPVTVQSQAVIYQMDRFEEAGLGVSTAWDESVGCVRTLTRGSDGSGQVDQWGFSMVGFSNSSGQSRFMPYLWNNGYELAYREDGSDEWETDITTDPAFVDVFSKWTNINNMEDVVPTGITEVDYPTAASYFAVGYTSMLLTGSNALGVAYANNPELKGKLGSFRLPGEYPGAILEAEGYVITAKSTDTQEATAAKYLEFFTSYDKDMKFWESSSKILSTTKGQKVSYITGDDYVGLLKQIEDGCHPALASVEVNGLKSALGDAYAAIFSNKKTSGQVVEQMVEDLGQLLEDYN